MNLTGEITVGNLLTAASVLISAAALAYSWRNDRQLRRLEYADRIRYAAGLTASVFDRWQTLVQQFFDGVQPLIVEIDELEAQGQDAAAARRALVRGMYEHRAAVRRDVREERIESAYVDLYGYDPNVHALFLATVARLLQIDDRAFDQLLHLAKGSQAAAPAPPPEPDQLASLGARCRALYLAHHSDSRAVIEAFHSQMLRLIQATDHQIISHRIGLASANEIFPRERD